MDEDDADALIVRCSPKGVGALLFSGFYQTVVSGPEFEETFSSDQMEYEHSADYSISRTIWNKLIAELLSEHEKEEILNAKLVKPEEFEPLSVEEKKIVEQILDQVHSHKARPSSTSLINLMNVEFIDTHLPHEFVLEGYVFGNLAFENCETKNDFSLRGAIILGSLVVKDCEFSNEADFSEISAIGFGGRLEFSGNRFEGITLLADSNIEKLATFVGTEFMGETSFLRTHFYDQVLFLNTVFGSSTDFTGVHFARDAPEFFGATIHEDTQFRNVHWPTHGKGIDASKNVRCYERLKLLLGSQGKFRQEHEFLRLEMKSCEASEGWLGSLPSRLFGLVSNYGWSYLRPLSLLLILGLFGGCALSLLVCDVSSGKVDLLNQCSRKMVGLSYSNLFSFLGLNRTIMKEEAELLASSTKAEGIAVSQYVLGPVLLFFFGLSLRNRFRMK